MARSMSAFGLATAVVGGLLVHGMAASSAAGTTPPWEPDPSAVGTITFYNSNGAVITGGKLSDSPFYAYAVGTSTPDAGYTNAKVELSKPIENSPTQAFSSDYMSGETADPVGGSAPASIVTASQSHAVSAGKSGDLTIAFFESEYPPNQSPASYANLYQVRLVTDNGATNSLHYDDADIMVDDSAGTWSEVYPTSSTPPAADPSSLTIGHSSATIAYGKSVTITGHLTDSTTKKSLSGKSVQLLAKPAGSTKFTQVKTVTTNSSGNVSATLKPTKNTQYEWHYAGSSANKAATSPIEKVTVNQTLTIASPGTAKPNTAFKVYGTAKPAGNGQKVALQLKSGTSWKTVSTTTIRSQKQPNGKTAVSYVFSVKEKKKGSYTFRVTKAATASNGAGTSGTITKKVS